MSRYAREFGELEANRSDPEDSDYNDKAQNASPSKKRKRTRRQSGGRSKKPRKPQKSGYGNDSDITSGEDPSTSQSSDGDFEESSPVEVTASGRPKRSVAQNTPNFKESSGEEEEEEEEAEESDEEEPAQENKQRKRPRLTHTPAPRGPSTTANKRKSLILKLPVNVDELGAPMETRRSTRTRTGSKSVKPDPVSAIGAQRRSSRQAHAEQEPLIALTDSGRHTQVVRQASTTPEAAQETVQHRATKGRKSAPKGSVIMEASQENSNSKRGDDKTADAVASAEDDDEDVQMQDPQMGGTQQSINPETGEGVIAESVQLEGENEGEDEDESDDPLVSVRPGGSKQVTRPIAASTRDPKVGQRLKRKAQDESSDFAPADEDAEDDQLSRSASPQRSSRRSSGTSQETGRRSQPRRIAKRRKVDSGSGSGEDSDGLDPNEIAEEAASLDESRKKKRQKVNQQNQIQYESKSWPKRQQKKIDYRNFKPELIPEHEEDEDQNDNRPVEPAPSGRGKKSAGPVRTLLSTAGPFGGFGGASSVLGDSANAATAAGGADSDSSDDDAVNKPSHTAGGTVGMTPTSAHPRGLMPQAQNNEPGAGASGGPTGFGKVKDKKNLADADPLGVDPNVSFEGVGGLDNHINQLKEMVALPLLYPEVFQQFNVTPPRGVLFHGPPGTGKTLLARALASSVSSQGKKVTFYMRKGADALSKWVGEAERQLRLLFEEARKNQPSIIFFDEIDGLAPVRSSKQEQIHASIVATLLALMDGMDGRGQVIVIGATNRPDTVDPALRRPGRFDREFYFPLPDQKARRSILDIHTRDWSPPLTPDFKNQLSDLTKGYGGADLRALCTEAALNAVQGTYPQIYKSNEKLVIDPTKIKVQAKDFMISVNKMIPSSERSGTSNAAPIDPSVEPLLRDNLRKIIGVVDEILPDRPKRTALEEAEFDDREDSHGFAKEMLQQGKSLPPVVQNFDRSRTYRPRLLIRGLQGMGQQHLAGALLHKFERFHVQSFDLSVLYSDATRSAEAAIIQLFNEAKRHKPSVMYIPDVNNWYETVGPAVTKMFTGLLRSLPPNDPVLLLGIMEQESEEDKPNEQMMRELFGYSTKNSFDLNRPAKANREEFFEKLMNMIKTPPDELPDPENRKRRELPQLEVAPAPVSQGPSKADLKAQKKQDRKTLNQLRIAINPIMSEMKKAYKRFRFPVIDENSIGYLFDEQDPTMVTTDIAEQDRPADGSRPFEFKNDSKGIRGIVETVTGKFFYNLDITTIEKRLVNGYYKRPKDYLADIERMAKDWITLGDEERALKAKELFNNVEVDMAWIEDTQPALTAACEETYARERQRSAQLKKQGQAPKLANVPPRHSTTQSTGPVNLDNGQPGSHQREPTSNGQTAGHSQLTNGETSPDSGHQNGNETHDGDVQMGNTEEAVPQSAPNTQTQKSQKSAITPMAANSQPGDYHNSASTTTSGQKTSDKSHSNPYGQNNTQSSTNGAPLPEEHPNFSLLEDMSGKSQIPDTQEQGASSGSGGSQQMPPPTTARATSISAILNNATNAGATDTRMAQQRSLNAQSEQPLFILTQDLLKSFHTGLVEKTSGCSVEQVEQINAVLMDVVWRKRGEWNRDNVLSAVADAFNRTIKDVEEMQKILPNSQNSGSGRKSNGSGTGSGSGRSSDAMNPGARATEVASGSQGFEDSSPEANTAVPEYGQAEGVIPSARQVFVRPGEMI
ncbi:MAG: hypothetical protein M1831_003921 [Alyxoria varia]|nr:MAG: hypothetical protein M1831_003921 [Alyxoria varia]